MKKQLFSLTALFFFTLVYAFGQSDSCGIATFLCGNNTNQNTQASSSTIDIPGNTICGLAITSNIVWYQVKGKKGGGTATINFSGVDSTTFKVGAFSGSCGSLTAVPDVNGCIRSNGSFSIQFAVLEDSIYHIAIDDEGKVEKKFTVNASGEVIENPKDVLALSDFVFNPLIGCLSDIEEDSVLFSTAIDATDSLRLGSNVRLFFSSDHGKTQYIHFSNSQQDNDSLVSYDSPGTYSPALRALNECPVDTTQAMLTNLSDLNVVDLVGSIAFRPITGTETANTTLASNPQMCGFDTIMFKGTANITPGGLDSPYDQTYTSEWKWIFGDPASGSLDTVIHTVGVDVFNNGVGCNRDSSVVRHSYGGRITPFFVTLIIQGQCGPDTVKDFLVDADTFKVQVSPDQEVCQGTPIDNLDTLTTQGTPPPSQPFSFYQWSKVSGPAVKIDSVNRPLTTFNFGTNLLNPGVYVFEFIIRDAEGCQARDSAQITINPRPIVTLPDTIGKICAYYPVPFDVALPFDTVSVTSGTPPYTFLWSPATDLSDPNIQNPISTPANTQSYTLNVVDSKTCDTTSLPMVVYVFPKPNPTPDPEQLCVNEVPLTAAFTIEWPEGSVNEPLGPHGAVNPYDSTINPSLNQPPDFVQDTIKWFPSTDYYVLDLASATDFQTATFTDTVTITADFTKSTKPRFVGIYDFEVWATNGSTGCLDTITGGFSVYDTITSATISASKTIMCENDSTQLDMVVDIPITPPIQLTYVWYRRNVSTGAIVPFSLATPPFFIQRPEGDWDFWAEVTNGDTSGTCSKNSDTIRVSVNSAPIVVATALEDTLCEADTITLDGSGSTYNPGSATIKWVSESGTPIENDTLITTTAIITKSERFRLVILYGSSVPPCSDTAFVDVNFHNKPAATFTLSKTDVCPASPDTVVLDGTGSNTDPRTTYAWSANIPGVTFDDGTALITTARNVIGQTIFTLTVTDSTRCDSSFTLSVDTLQRPSLGALPTSLCLESVNDIQLFSVGQGIDTSSFVWSVIPAIPADSIHYHSFPTKDTLAHDTIEVHVVAGGTYTFTVIVTDSSNGCVATLNYDYVVADSAENVLSPDEEICEGDSSQLSVTVTAATFKWTCVAPVSGDPSLAVNGQDTTKTPLVKPVAIGGVPTTYLYRVVSTAGVCSDIDTIQITVNPVRTSSFTIDSPICNGFSSTVNYTGNGDKLTDIYHWNFSGGNPIPTPPTPPAPGDSSAMEVTWPDSGVYDVVLYVESSLGCFSDTITQQVRVVANPTSEFTLSNQACVGQLANGVATFAGKDTVNPTFAWNFGSGASPGSSTSVGPHNITWDATGIKVVTLTVTNTGGCASGETQHSIDIRPSPNLELGPDRSLCDGSTLILDADDGYVTYQWQRDGVATGGNFDTLKFTVTAGVTTGNYSVTVTDADGCTSSDNVIVSIGPYTPAITPDPGSASICQGNFLLLTADAGDAYIWSTGSITDTIHALSAGTYTVTITNGGCTGTADIVAVVQPNPDAGFSIDDNTLCLNATGLINTNESDVTFDWLWNFGAGSSTNPAGGPGPIQITYSTAGVKNITLSLTNLATGCFNQRTVPVTVNALPTITAINNFPGGPKCKGDSVNLSTTPGGFTSYLWSSPQDIVFRNPTSASTFTIFNQSGDITVLATDANGCTDDTTASVVVNPFPLDSSTTFCQGITGTIGIKPNGLTITGNIWSGGPVVIPGLLTCTVNPTQTTTYNARVSYSPSCVSNISVIANVNIPDTFADQDTVEVCDDVAYKITFDSTNFNSINWSPADSISSTIFFSPTIFPIPALNKCIDYKITVVDKTNGCTGVDTFNLCRTSSINAEAGADTVRLCIIEGAPSMNYTLDGTASTAQTLRWVSANPLMDVASPTAPVFLQVPDKNNPPFYNFMLIGSSPGCTNDTDRIVVTFYQYTKPDGGNNVTICGGDVQLTVLQGYVTNSWYTITPGASVKNQTNPLNPLVTPSLSANPSLFVFQTSNGNGCISTDTVTVTIGGSLTPTLLVDPAISVCNGDSVHLTASGGTNYQFFEDNNSLGAASQINKYSFKASATHSYKVTATASGCAPVTTAPTTVTVRPLPVVSIISPVFACDKTDLQLAVDNNVSLPPSTVVWSPTTGLNNPTSITPVFSQPLAGQSYSFKVVGTLTACKDSDVVNFTANALPVADAGQNDTICANETVQIGPVNNPGNQYKYTWTSVPSGLVNDSTLLNPTTAPLSSNQTFTFTLLDTTTQCSASANTTVVVGAEPVYSLPTDTIFACIEDTVTISGATSDPANKFNWTATGYTINNPNSLTPSVITLPQIDTIPLVFNVKSPGGCLRRDTIFIGLYNDALANFTSGTACAGDTMFFTDSSSRAFRWLWDFGDAAVTNDTSTSKDTGYVYTAGGTYSVNLTINKGSKNCESNVQKVVSVFGTPNAKFTVDKPEKEVYPLYTFTNLTSGLDNTMTVEWDFGDGTTLVDNGKTVTHKYTFADEDSFKVVMKVTNQDGCLDSFSLKRDIGMDAPYDYPNVFTPNGDGTNDAFIIRGLEVFQSSNLVVFNRWGAEVYRKKNYQNDWKAEGVSDGVYYWIMEYNYKTRGTLKGWLTVIR